MKQVIEIFSVNQTSPVAQALELGVFGRWVFFADVIFVCVLEQLDVGFLSSRM